MMYYNSMTQASTIPTINTTPYWEAIQASANKNYKKSTAAIDITIGLESRRTYIDANQGPYGDLSITIPLYDPEQRRKLFENKQAFIKIASELIQTIEYNKSIIPTLKEKAVTLEKLIRSGDPGIINQYYITLEAIQHSQAAINHSKRQLDIIINDT